MDSYSENTEWIDISEEIQNVKFQETQSPIMEQNDNTEEKVSRDTRELIDSIVANIVDNAIETVQTDLYTEVETSSQNIPKEKEQEENNNGFYYDVFKLVSVLAGCRLFFEFIEITKDARQVCRNGFTYVKNKTLTNGNTYCESTQRRSGNGCNAKLTL